MRIKIIKYLTFFMLLINPTASSIENKILFKVNNEIITSIDLYNEIKYLKALNPNLKNLESNKMLEIAKNSLLREKIKEIEISKYNLGKINQQYLDNILSSIYTNIGLKNIDDFLEYINTFEINLEVIKTKLTTEAFWNQIIYQKFFSKLKIDKNQIKKDIESAQLTTKSYQLNEIIFSVSQTNDYQKLLKNIKESIIENGFENTAAIYSISDSSKNGGNLGWISENFIDKKILDEINKIEVGQYTQPILIPSGFLMIQVKNAKEEEKKIDIEKEFNLRVQSLQNQQLNQYSNIYFKKIKKDILIDEK
jgi:peptidyl-prolyl cis-trans isomerase SurA